MEICNYDTIEGKLFHGFANTFYQSLFYIYLTFNLKWGKKKGKGGLKERESVCDMRVFCLLTSWYFGTQGEWRIKGTGPRGLGPHVLFRPN